MRQRPAAGIVATVVAFLLIAASVLPAGTARAQDLASIPPLSGPVIDTTNTLDPATRQRLTEQALALQQRKGSQLQVLMVPTTQPEDISQYAVRAYEQYRLGREKVDDGVLLVVAKNDRRARIEVGYGLEGAIPDATAIRVISEHLVPKFRAGDFDGGVSDATAALVKLIDAEELPTQQNEAIPELGIDRWFFALAGAFVVAQVMHAVLLLTGARWSLRSGIGAVVSGGVAWSMSSLPVVAVLGALLAVLISLPSRSFARGDGWGSLGASTRRGARTGGSTGTRSRSGSSGGRSGGGGASGSW